MANLRFTAICSLDGYAALWQAADKTVYSATLDAVVTQRTRLVRAFDAEEVRRLKASASAGLTVAGPTLGCRCLALPPAAGWLKRSPSQVVIFNHLGVRGVFQPPRGRAGEAEGQPPAMAVTTRKASLPAITSGGSGVSGGSWERSS